jgi:hypothetical protein
MPTFHIDPDTTEWTSAVPIFGPNAVYDGTDVIQLKVLCDRRSEGGRITWIARFRPPARKFIKIVAIAMSDEHIFNLEGGRGTKSGARASGGYGLNTEGQPHSAMISQETESLIVYTRELSLDICDLS